VWTADFPAGYEAEQEWYRVFVRAAIAPGAAIAEFRRYLPVDIRSVLPTIQAPTILVSDLDAEGDDISGPEMSPLNARLAADLIPGSRLVELPGGTMIPRRHWYVRAESILSEIGGLVARLRREEASFDRALTTVLFTDIVDSSATAASLGDQAWRGLVERHNAIVRGIMTRYRGEERDTAGDGFFATFDGPARAVYCGSAIVAAVGQLGLRVRVGIHTGEVQTIDGKVGGMAVIIGARVCEIASASEVLTSSTVKDLVAGSGLAFEDAGEHELKGVPDRWRLYRVVDG
jgi:class 3 adenylate cyclase